MEQWYVLARRALAIAWSRRWLLILVSWGVCLSGWAFVALMPNTYETAARLYVDTDAVLTPLLQGLAIDTRTEGQLGIMQRTLLSGPNLYKLIAVTDLNLSINDEHARQALVQQLGRQITINSSEKNLFTIQYRNPNPQLAFQVVTALVNIFMERATAANTADMQNAQRFLDQQIASFEAQLRAAEQRRAAFKRKYMDILPLASGGMSPLDSARGAVGQLEGQLQNARARRAALLEEARITPTVIVGGSNGGVSPIESQIAAAEAKLLELRTRYTDQHPDVIILRKLIESLKATAKELPRVPAASAEKTGIAMPNPLYTQLKLQLIEVDATINSLQEQIEAAKRHLASVDALAQSAPEVLAQSEDLDRDYDILRKNYGELIARKEASKITAAADTGADRVRLRIIDPPQVSLNPVAPNRLLLNSGVLLAGLGAAIALAFVFYQSDQSVNDIGRLRELGAPVLGGISLVPAVAKHHRAYAQAVSALTAVLVLLILYGGIAFRGVNAIKGLL